MTDLLIQQMYARDSFINVLKSKMKVFFSSFHKIIKNTIELICECGFDYSKVAQKTVINK